MKPLMIPYMTLPANNLKKILKTVSGMAFSQLGQSINDNFITPCASLVEKYRPACLACVHFKLRYQIMGELTLYHWF